jgi:hypothetical protein
MSLQALLFWVSIVFSFVAWGMVAQRYIWPALRDRPRADALRPILLLHGFRFLGLAFLIPGVVSPDLSLAFAFPAAFGDLATAILALLASATRGRLSTVLVWAFSILGTLDLLNAFYQGNRTGLVVDPGLLGAAYFIPTLVVPLLFVTHGLVFRLLLRKQVAAVTSIDGRRAA